MSLTNLIRDWVIDPLGLIFLLSLFLLLCLLITRRSRWLFVGALLWFVTVAVVSAPRVVNPLLLHYEDQFSDQPACLSGSPIVILGGGVDSRATSDDQLQYLDPPTFARLNAGRTLARQYPQAPVMVVGGALREVSESSVMANYLIQVGVDAARIVEEDQSRNTFENAVNIKAVIDNLDIGASINLVTSALHMGRAKSVFEKQGIQVCAVGVDQQGLHNVPIYAMWPQTSALLKFDLLLHEVIAGIAYRAKGWL